MCVSASDSIKEVVLINGLGSCVWTMSKHFFNCHIAIHIIISCDFWLSISSVSLCWHWFLFSCCHFSGFYGGLAHALLGSPWLVIQLHLLNPMANLCQLNQCEHLHSHTCELHIYPPMCQPHNNTINNQWLYCLALSYKWYQNQTCIDDPSITSVDETVSSGSWRIQVLDGLLWYVSCILLAYLPISREPQALQVVQVQTHGNSVRHL